MHRPGIEPAISRSQLQRPNHYTTEQPSVSLYYSSTEVGYVKFQVSFVHFYVQLGVHLGRMRKNYDERKDLTHLMCCAGQKKIK